jgi:hypothetical protein
MRAVHTHTRAEECAIRGVRQTVKSTICVPAYALLRERLVSCFVVVVVVVGIFGLSAWNRIARPRTSMFSPILLPSMSAVPALASRKPVSMLIAVDLPAFFFKGFRV